MAYFASLQLYLAKCTNYPPTHFPSSPAFLCHPQLQLQSRKRTFFRVVSLPKHKYPKVMIKVKTGKPCLKSIFLSDSPFFLCYSKSPLWQLQHSAQKAAEKYTKNQTGLDKRKKENAPPVMPCSHYSRLPRVWVSPSHLIWTMWSAGHHPWTAPEHQGQPGHTQPPSAPGGAEIPAQLSQDRWILILKDPFNPSILSFSGSPACSVQSVRYHCVEGFGCWN